MTLDIVSYHAGTPVRVEIKKIGLRLRNPIRFPRHLIKYPPATTHGTVGTTTDDILTNPIRGAEHHNQTRSFPALADNSGPVRFGATAIKPLISAGSDPDAA